MLTSSELKRCPLASRVSRCWRRLRSNCPTPETFFIIEKSRPADRRNRPKAPFTLVNLSRRNELRIAAFEHAPAHPLEWRRGSRRRRCDRAAAPKSLMPRGTSTSRHAGMLAACAITWGELGIAKRDWLAPGNQTSVTAFTDILLQMQATADYHPRWSAASPQRADRLRRQAQRLRQRQRRFARGRGVAVSAALGLDHAAVTKHVEPDRGLRRADEHDVRIDALGQAQHRNRRGAVAPGDHGAVGESGHWAIVRVERYKRWSDEPDHDFSECAPKICF